MPYPMFNKRTPGDLLRYSREHVAYEFRMLHELSQLPSLPSGTYGPDWARRQVIVEGFALHLRNVLAFLFGSHDRAQASQGRLRFVARDGDFLAEEYCVPGWRGRVLATLTVDGLNRLERAQERSNAEIAHLTGERIDGTPTAKQWRPAELRGDLVPALGLLKAEATRGSTMETTALAVLDLLLGPMGPSWADPSQQTVGYGFTGPAGPPSS